MNEAVIAGIAKSKIEWGASRNKINAYADTGGKLKLILLNSPVGSVLLYGLHIIPISKPLITKNKIILLCMYKIDNTRAIRAINRKAIKQFYHKRQL